MKNLIKKVIWIMKQLELLQSHFGVVAKGTYDKK